MTNDNYIIPIFNTIENSEYTEIYAKPELQILPRIEEVAYMLLWLKDQGIFFETGNFYDITPNEYYKINSENVELPDALITAYHLKNSAVISNELYEHILYTLNNETSWDAPARFEPYIAFRSHLYPAQIFALINAINSNIAIASWKSVNKNTWDKMYLTDKYTDKYDDYEDYCPFFPSELSENREAWPTPYYPYTPPKSDATHPLTELAHPKILNDLMGLSIDITP